MSSVISQRSSLAFLVIMVLTFLAASSAPTPLYQVYQDHLHFSAAMLTAIFGVYAVSLLAALLTVGSLSDYLGRKPVIFVALLLNSVAMLLFIHADSTACLLAARALQGFATGTATAVLSATLLDTDRVRGPMLNSLAPMLGMASGGLGSGLLVEFAPWPTQLIYYTLLGLMVLQALYVWRLPETVSRIPGALKSLAPTLHVPPQARRALWLAMPLNVAVWALGGFFSSLAPSLASTRRRVARGVLRHGVQRQVGVRIGGAGTHLGGDPDGLHQLLLGGALAQRAGSVAADAVGALCDMGDRHGDQFLGLGGQGAVGEHGLAEGLEGLGGIRRQLLAPRVEFARGRGVHVGVHAVLLVVVGAGAAAASAFSNARSVRRPSRSRWTKAAASSCPARR